MMLLLCLFSRHSQTCFGAPVACLICLTRESLIVSDIGLEYSRAPDWFIYPYLSSFSKHVLHTESSSQVDCILSGVHSSSGVDSSGVGLVLSSDLVDI